MISLSNFDNIISGTYGNLYSLSLKESDIRSVEQLLYKYSNGIIEGTSYSSFTDISMAGEDSENDTETVLYCYESDVLYLYLSSDILTSGTVGISVYKSPQLFNDSIEISDEDLELFVYYAIKEASIISGNIVPPSVELAIRKAESES